MTNLRREPGAFFFFLLINFFLVLTMCELPFLLRYTSRYLHLSIAMFFRTIASASRTLTQALAPAAILILALVIYAGFAIPVRNMLGWSRWINYLNPVCHFACSVARRPAR